MPPFNKSPSHLILRTTHIAALNLPPFEHADQEINTYVPPLRGKLHPRDYERLTQEDMKRAIEAKKERDGQDWSEKVRLMGGGVDAHLRVLWEGRGEEA